MFNFSSHVTMVFDFHSFDPNVRVKVAFSILFSFSNNPTVPGHGGQLCIISPVMAPLTFLNQSLYKNVCPD